jgi:DNA-binding MarR family transcriptional regulator
MSRDQELLSSAALLVFKLNGQFLELAEHLARPAGITAAWWQVLGAVINEPLSVSAISREMGITRQAVQRTADVLVGRDLAEYRENPAHRRAKLVAVTQQGRAAISLISPHHALHARALSGAAGQDRLAEMVTALAGLSQAMDTLELER